MIQPVSAFSPRAGFRGNNGTYGKRQSVTNEKIALINAGGIALAAGGLGTALARSQTSSWAQAGVLGLCASFLTMFFMTPHLVKNSNVQNMNKNADKAETLLKEDSPKFFDAIKEHFAGTRKYVQFKQS